MDEEVNYCSQCGVEANLEAKFCSSCGSALDGIDGGLSSVLKPLHGGWSFLKKYSKRIAVISTTVAVLSIIVVTVIGLWELYLNQEYERTIQQVMLEREAALQDMRIRIEEAQGRPIVRSEWEVVGEIDPANGRKIVRSVSIKSNDGLCRMMVEHRITSAKLTRFDCEFEIVRDNKLSIKFDELTDALTIRPGYFQEEPSGVASTVYVDVGTAPKAFSEKGNYRGWWPIGSDYYWYFLRHVSGEYGSTALAIMITPSGLNPIWVKFSLKGAKEAIAKLGKEM
jgi:hypothetical protein